MNNSNVMQAEWRLFKQSTTLSGYGEIVEFLVRNGSEINAQNNAGVTPLHTAVYNGMGIFRKTILISLRVSF